MKSNNVDIIDFHAHVLPGADHGSRSLNTSLFQLKCAKSAGVTRIIATPHYFPHAHTLEDFIEKRKNSFKILKPHLNEDQHPILRVGCEILLYPHLDRLDGIEELCIFGSNIMLIELPMTEIDNEHIDTLKSFLDRGFNVILAHADRYNTKYVNEIINLGIKVQLNTEPFSKMIKPQYLTEWIKNGSVVAFGSDIHGTDKRAYNRFNKAILKNAEYIKYIEEESNKLWDQTKEFVF